MTNLIAVTSAALLALTMAGQASARGSDTKFSVSPYFSMKSKTVKKKDKNDPTKEVATTRTRSEYGVKGSVRFLKMMKASLSVGQNTLSKEEEVSELKDEYGEIDFEEDLGTSNHAPTDIVKSTETQTNAKFTLSVLPKVGPIIVKVGAGVTGRMRVITSEINGEKQPTITKGPTYKPHTVMGAGMKLTPKTGVMLEYELYHYKFPKLEPFERSVTLSFNVGI